MRNIIITICCVLFFCQSAFAAPAITGVSGVVANGQTLTISGSGFGVKSPAAPLLWENFEGGTNNTKLSTSSEWDAYSGGSSYTNALAYSGGMSTRNVAYYGSGTGFNTDYYTIQPDATEIYASYMFAHNGTGYNAGVPKNWRLRAGGSAYSGSPGSVSLSDGYVFYEADATSVYPEDDNGSGRYFSEDVYGVKSWVRYQVYGKHSTPNATNGKYVVSIGGEVKTFADISTRNATDVYFKTFLLGLMHDSGSMVEGDYHEMYIDDVYIDTTPARVELSASPTWNQTSKSNVQIPADWADDEITITTNVASLEVGATYYLYVVTNDESVNTNGFPVTLLGASSDPDPTTHTTSGPILRIGTHLLRVGDSVLRVQ